MTTSEPCHNCNGVLEANAIFCPRCGQKVHLHRFTLHEIAHEALHAVTHADKGFLVLLKDLALRPGLVAREYVIERKRKRYFSPFTFLAITLAISLAVNGLLRPYTTTLPPVPGDLAPKLRAMIERRDQFFGFLERRGNYVTLASIPFVAFFFWLLLGRKRGLFYAELLVGQIFFSGFMVAVDALLFIPVVHRLVPPMVFAATRISFTVLYSSLVYRQFLAMRGPLSFGATFVIALLAMMVWGLLSSGAGALYIWFG